MIKTSIYAVSYLASVWLPQGGWWSGSNYEPSWIASIFTISLVLFIFTRVNYHRADEQNILPLIQTLVVFRANHPPSNRRGLCWIHDRVCFRFHDLIIVESFKNDCLSFDSSVLTSSNRSKSLLDLTRTVSSYFHFRLCLSMPLRSFFLDASDVFSSCFKMVRSSSQRSVAAQSQRIFVFSVPFVSLDDWKVSCFSIYANFFLLGIECLRLRISDRLFLNLLDFVSLLGCVHR